MAQAQLSDVIGELQGYLHEQDQNDARLRILAARQRRRRLTDRELTELLDRTYIAHDLGWIIAYKKAKVLTGQ